MRTFVRLALTALFVAALGPSIAVDTPSSEVWLNLEVLLTDRSGVHLVSSKQLEVQQWGRFHQIVKFADDDPSKGQLVYSLAHERLDSGRIRLTLERSVSDGRERRELASVSETIPETGTWLTTLVGQDAQVGVTLELRVVTALRERKFDEDFAGTRIGMHLRNGPVIEYSDLPRDASGAFQDRVLFRGISISGATQGLELGIRGLGVVRLSHYRFPEASPCGQVRGARYRFEVGGRSFVGFSDARILPEDPDRPGKGWLLYCTLTPGPVDRGGYHGTFDPAKVE